MTVLGQVTAVVGGQYGSEGKGAIVAAIADEYDVHVRTGAPNAGHSYYVDSIVAKRKSRVKVVARGIPVGASNPNAILVIGAGGLVDIELLTEEADILADLGLSVAGRLFVDTQANVIDPDRHHAWEGGTEGRAHELIGSTGEGVGPARMAKISRGTMPSPSPTWASTFQAGEWTSTLREHGIVVTDTAGMLNELIDDGHSVLLEGTQGSGLSLTHGIWPYVTSSDTNAAQLASDCGIAPRLVQDVILVCRTFPIRVAGNSGPLPNETTWDAIGRAPETTTVTKKVRRVGTWYAPLVRRAIMLNRPTSLAITFLDYWHKNDYGCTDWNALTDDARASICHLADELGVTVSHVGTGPDSVIKLPHAIVPVADVDGWPSIGDAYMPLPTA